MAYNKYPTQQLPDGNVVEVYSDNTFRILFNVKDLIGKIAPVCCNHCGKVYDLTEVKPIHRYQDCDLFRSPCCNKLADTRTYKSFPDFTKVSLEVTY